MTIGIAVKVWGLTVVLLFTIRGLSDVSSLVPIGTKYTVKWSAPLLQVQVAEVGQEDDQGTETLFQLSKTRHVPGGPRPSHTATSHSFNASEAGEGP